MNLRDEAKRRLAEYRYRKHAVERLPEEIRRLEVIAERMGASDLDGDPVQGGESNQEDALLKNIEAREMLARRLRDNVDWVECVEDALSVLTEEEQLILRKLEMNPESGGVERLCQLLGLKKSRLYQRRDQAFAHFVMSIFGGSEEKSGKKVDEISVFRDRVV